MSGFDRIVKMIEGVNAPTIPLSRDNIQFGGVLANQEARWNTRLPVNSIPGGGYRGSVEIYYTRVNLSDMASSFNFVQEEAFTLAGLLDKINKLKGAQLTLEDITNEDIPFMETGVVSTFQLSAAESSLIWLGNTQINLVTGIPEEAQGLATFLNFDLPGSMPR